jgi:type VI protein secretion system component VasK
MMRIAPSEHPRLSAVTDRKQQGTDIMKAITVLAVALGLGSLAACNNNPNEQAADNIEANAENVADTMEANVDNAADMMQANTENAADAVRAEGENKADAVREGADADGNSAN